MCVYFAAQENKMCKNLRVQAVQYPDFPAPNACSARILEPISNMLGKHTNTQAPTLILQHRQTPTFQPVQHAAGCRLGKTSEEGGHVGSVQLGHYQSCCKPE